MLSILIIKNLHNILQWLGEGVGWILNLSNML